MEMTTHDRELLHQLLEDWSVIQSHLAVWPPKLSIARAVFAPILRRWIIERNFFRAQRVFGAPITFDIYSEGAFLKLCKAGVLEHWMGFIRFPPLEITTSRLSEPYRGKNGQATVPIPTTRPSPAPQEAKQFFQQRIFFWRGKFYTRSDTLKFLANTLGGVHFSFERLAAEKHIGEIKEYLGFQVLGRNYQMLVGPKIAALRDDPVARDTVYDAIELTTIDTARIFSEGIRRSFDQIQAVLKA
jgi:hypothetical protein